MSAFILSCLDYCNLVFADVLTVTLSLMQRVIYATVCLVAGLHMPATWTWRQQCEYCIANWLNFVSDTNNISWCMRLSTTTALRTSTHYLFWFQRWLNVYACNHQHQVYLTYQRQRHSSADESSWWLDQHHRRNCQRSWDVPRTLITSSVL